MPRLRSSLATAVALCALALAGCAKTVQTAAYPGLEKAQSGVSAVAVAPFSAIGRGGVVETEGPSAAAAPVVARQIAEALSKNGVNVVPPEDVGRAIENAGLSLKDADPKQIAAVAMQKFGANMLLMGQVTRFRGRKGDPLGAQSPASVGFRVTLFDAPAATRLWSATFDETQQPVSTNLFNLGRYPGGGTRWLTAEELSKWGAEGVASSFPISAK